MVGGTEPLHGWRSVRFSPFTRLLMLQTVRRPGHGLEPVLLYRPAINHTGAESAVNDSPQGVSDLVQRRPIGLGFRELLVSQLISRAVIADVVCGSVPGLPHAGQRSLDAIRQPLLFRK